MEKTFVISLILLFSSFAFSQNNVVNPVQNNTLEPSQPADLNTYPSSPTSVTPMAPYPAPPGIIVFEPRQIMPDPNSQPQQNNLQNQNQSVRTYCPAGDTTCEDDRTSR